MLCISNLIHALQREREASNIFLGSDGKRFSDQRVEQLGVADRERSHFEQEQRLQQMSDELRAAKETLEDRKTQEKTVLLLMNHRQISNDEAHKLLRKLAMNQGKKLPDVARGIVSM